MSDDSLESVVIDTVSEPVQDTKESTVKETVEVEETETELKEPVEEVKLSKYEQEKASHEKSKHAMQQRYNRMTAANKAEIEKTARLEAQVKELTPAVAVDNSPKEEDFANFDDFLKADVDHKVQEGIKANSLAEKQGQLAEANRVQHETNRKMFEEKEHAFRTSNPEYTVNCDIFNEQVVMLQAQGRDKTPTFQAMSMMISDSSTLTPQIINELGAKPEFVEELMEMSPIAAVRELVKLENSFSSSSTETKPLPAPIKGVKGKGTPSKRMEDMSPAELSKHLGLG